MSKEESVTVSVPEEIRMQLRIQLITEKATLLRRIELIDKAIAGMELPEDGQAVGEGAALEHG